MGIVYNGDSNSLTGVGSPNPVKLILPMLDQIEDPAVQAALLRIQQFVNNLVAPSGGAGGYASLTGAGETTTPGDLTQAGGLEVDVPTGDSFAVFQNYGNAIVQSEGGGSPVSHGTITVGSGASATDGFVSIISSDTVTITGGTGVSGEVNGHIKIGAQYVVIEGGQLAMPSSMEVGFFGQSPALQQTILGSRSGNAALANLLSGLATLGLIVDSTT